MAYSSPQFSTEHLGIEVENDSPIEEVRLTVPVDDDPTLPTLTFRTWVVGLVSCAMLAFLSQFFGYRQNPIYMTPVAIQIAALPLGKLMARTLPTKRIKVPFTGWYFSMNPGPFNIKEHVLISLLASTGSGGVYGALSLVTLIKAFYHRPINPVAAFLLVLVAQFLGYGWAGLYRKQLVDSPYCWWPTTVANVPFFRALHDKEVRPNRGLTRLQFFLVVFISSFVYYIFPGYLFQSLSVISALCIIWKDSIRVQQIGSGYYGLGLGSFTFDWSVITMLGSPLAYPASSMFNSLVGFVLAVYVALPLVYYNNVYNARKFPIISSDTFDSEGNPYNISRILQPGSIAIDWDAYDNYSKMYLSPFFAINYGLGFASMTATFSHTALFHGREILDKLKITRVESKNQPDDVHTRLMKQNYSEVPQMWFYFLLVAMLAIAFWACEGFDKQLQLPWWGVLLGCLLTVTFIYPAMMILATTGVLPAFETLSSLAISYAYPGKPIANITFDIITNGSFIQTQSFLSDFKLGVYMKIPPKAMFITQVVGTVVASIVCFSTAWWLLTTIEHICDPSLLPEGSPWTCPYDNTNYNTINMWGLVGPLHLFSKLGVYPEMNWFFLFGILAPLPVWALTKKYPEKKWLAYINMPIILSAPSGMPPLRAVNYISWMTVGIFFNYFVYKRYKQWWSRHTYILSAALNGGLAILAVFLNFTLQHQGIYGPKWWGLKADDHCPLAKCPTAPGIKVQGCPLL